MQTRKFLFLLTLVLSHSFLGIAQTPSRYAVLPEPQQIEYAKGTFQLKDRITVAFPQELANEAAYCRDAISCVSTIHHPILQEGKTKADIVLSLDASVLPEHPEGYILEIKRKGIVIKANAPAGILHGIQTLRQLTGTHVETGHAPSQQCGVITDYPALGWRAFMLDEARHFKGKEVVFKLLDNMSRLKMNVFHWHLVDNQGWRIEINQYPELTKTGAARDVTTLTRKEDTPDDGKPHGGFYTQEEIREVVAYASARHITIVPEIEIPGHSSAAIASYPWLGSGVVLNLTDPAVENFLTDVLDEVIALFPGKVIHIGGDEVKYGYWKTTPSIVQYMQENNILSPADLQVGFVNKVAHRLASKNRRIMGWVEVIGKIIPDYWRPMLPEDHIIKQPLDSNVIVHCWEGNTDLIKEIIRDGYDIVNSFYKMTYLDLLGERFIPLEKAYSFQPVPEGLTAEEQKKVLGLGCQMWSEQVPDEQVLNKRVYPRIAAYAECGWTSPEKKDYNRFLKALEYFLKDWKKQEIEYGELTFDFNITSGANSGQTLIKETHEI
jgi:hexosaminidase